MLLARSALCYYHRQAPGRRAFRSPLPGRIIFERNGSAAAGASARGVEPAALAGDGGFSVFWSDR